MGVSLRLVSCICVVRIFKGFCSFSVFLFLDKNVTSLIGASNDLLNLDVQIFMMVITKTMITIMNMTIEPTEQWLLTQ